MKATIVFSQPSLTVNETADNSVVLTAIIAFASVLQGPPGPRGADGADGLSAYQIWLAAGHTGTIADFLASLVGPQGPAGANGSNGTNGTNGTDGKSAYELWLEAGHTGSVADFLASLIGPQGPAGSGGLTNYDFTHVANTTVSTSTTTITFAANQRGSQMITVSADIGITFDVRNLSDNYLWIKNTGSSEIDVTISSVVNDQTTVSNVYVPTDGISVPAGGLCEIGIVRNADGAFITSRNDLEL